MTFSAILGYELQIVFVHLLFIFWFCSFFNLFLNNLYLIFFFLTVALFDLIKKQSIVFVIFSLLYHICCILYILMS